MTLHYVMALSVKDLALLEDKLRIARKLDEFGVHYIEGGWPGSNPKMSSSFNAHHLWV